MTFSPEPVSVRLDDDNLWVELEDGRTIGMPLAWFPRLFHASVAERQAFELSRCGIHWEAIDEDISIAGLLAGRGDMMRHGQPATAIVPVTMANPLYTDQKRSFADVLLDYPGGIEFERDITPIGDIDL